MKDKKIEYNNRKVVYKCDNGIYFIAITKVPLKYMKDIQNQKGCDDKNMKGAKYLQRHTPKEIIYNEGVYIAENDNVSYDKKKFKNPFKAKYLCNEAKELTLKMMLKFGIKQVRGYRWREEQHSKE